jgi:hypothetical protein
MKREIILVVMVLLITASFSMAQVRHSDYATGVEIKFCNECHVINNVEPNHGAFWINEHRYYREKLPSNCNDCHQQSFCSDCHYGGGIDRDLHVSQSIADYMPKTHRTDWKEIHPIKALDDPRNCFRCHDERRFCAECHSKFNPNDLRFISHRRGWSDLEVKKGGPRHSVFNTAQCRTCHPNSVLPVHQWSSSHAREARQNLATCQTCHADGDVCLKCHSAMTGLKVNPHPKNWRSIAGRLGSASSNVTCIKCHKGGVGR